MVWRRKNASVATVLYMVIHISIPAFLLLSIGGTFTNDCKVRHAYLYLCLRSIVHVLHIRGMSQSCVETQHAC